jgi:hypothetical protein
MKEQTTIETRFCVTIKVTKTDPKRSWRCWGKARSALLNAHHITALFLAPCATGPARRGRRGDNGPQKESRFGTILVTFMVNQNRPTIVRLPVQSLSGATPLRSVQTLEPCLNWLPSTQPRVLFLAPLAGEVASAARRRGQCFKHRAGVEKHPLRHFVTPPP